MNKTTKRIGWTMGAVGAAVVGARTWTASVWPAYENHRVGYYHAMNCYSALTERTEAIGFSNPIAPSFYRLQRQNLVYAKIDTQSVLIYYVHTNESIGGTFDTYFGNAVDGADFPLYSDTTVCIRAAIDLPTNFFTYTPWRCLNGLGPLTNGADYAAIGRGHGWTNASTAVGGTSHCSRTEWYTTDYGWEGVKACINVLLWTRSLSPAWAGNVGVANAVDWPAAVTNAGYVAAQNECEAGSPQYITNGSLPYAFTVGSYGVSIGGGLTNWAAAAQDRTGKLVAAHPATQMLCDIDFYIQVQTYDPSSYTNEWGDQGYGFNENKYNHFDTVAGASQSSVTSDWVGGAIDASFAFQWTVTDPQDGGDGATVTRGWEHEASSKEATLFKWNVTDGFDYR